jgi:Ca2+:H+ antiporter
MMTLAIIALVIPAIFGHSIERDRLAVEELSLGVAGVMIIIYALSLIYSFRSAPATQTIKAANWSLRLVLLALALSILFTAWLSEILVETVEPVVQSLGVTEFFLGVIIVPLVGNVVEHLVAVQTAWKNKMDLSLAISLGSSMQIALFVAPLLVFISLLGPEPLSLIFNQFELISLGAAVGIATFISLDGESNWLEGAELLAVYCIIAIAFFFLPS